MPMNNLDARQNSRNAILQRMTEAVRNNDSEAFAQAYNDLARSIEENLRGEIQELQASQDTDILTARGVRVLTSQERTFYTGLIEAMRSDAPQQALTGVETVLPETVIDSIFDDLTQNHPLLSIVNFQNTRALIKLLTSKSGGVAAWGPLGKKISDELSAQFTETNLTLAQLTAFIPIPKYVLDLGPEWMDRYVRELLGEATATQLEVGIIDGTGKDMPVGMNRKLTGAMDGVHSVKDTVTVTDLSPTTYGTLLSTLAKGPNDKTRAVTRVMLAVNPTDYFTKVLPGNTVRSADGRYVNDVFPFQTDVVQSAAVPSGKAVFGIAKKYLMALGTQKGGKIEYSDHYQFLEQNRVYAVHLYGYGQALDENAFIYLDISGLKPTNLKVEVVENP